jgi:hypothetical protein
MDEARLLEKLKAIEALHAGAMTDGERAAAASAHTRILARLHAERAKEKEIEMVFTLSNAWSRDLFMALCRRYELKPYRYKRQRRTTLNVKAPKSFIEKTLWPEFVAINDELKTHIDEITTRIIKSAIHGDTTDADEIAGALSAGAASVDGA